MAAGKATRPEPTGRELSAVPEGTVDALTSARMASWLAGSRASDTRLRLIPAWWAASTSGPTRSVPSP